MAKCNECGKDKPDVKHRIDKGLSVGEMCKECFDAMIEKCRQRSW